MKISKSLYTRGIQCPKSLWLKKHKAAVLTLPDASTDAILETGNSVVAFTCKLFPNVTKAKVKILERLKNDTIF